MNQKKLLLQALYYAENRGKSIFPCSPRDKKPLTQHGFVDASSDVTQIRKWWEERPEAMIGMPTGAINGFWVVDCDGTEGINNFAALCSSHNYEPVTLIQQTPSGGCHYFFKMPEGIEIRNSASKLAKHVDIRGNGGYVVVAPSKMDNGRCYSWMNKIQPVAAPDWIIELVIAKKSTITDVARNNNKELLPTQGFPTSSPYVHAAIEEEYAKVSNAKPGARNATLNNAAFAIGTLSSLGALDEGTVQDALMQAARDCGLVADDGEAAVLKTIRSGIEGGKQRPRGLPVSSHSSSHTSPSSSDGEGSEEAGGNQSPTEILPPPPATPLNAFPEQVRTLVEEASTAFSVPTQVPAAVLLSLVSCLVGRSRAVQVKEGWAEHANLWIVLAAPSGLGKTPVANAFFKHVEEFEYRLFEKWKVAYDEYQQQLSDYARSKPESRGANPVPPQRTQFYVDDATVEALSDVLSQNPRGILWKTDEISGLLSDFDKYNNNGKHGGTRGRLLSSYDSGPWKTNRRDSSKNTHIPHACVSIFGGIQPKMLARCFDGSDIDSGFLQRFLFIRAEREVPAFWSDTGLSNESQDLLRRITEGLSSFKLRTSEVEGSSPYVVPLSEGARRVFVEWYNELAREGWEDINSEASDALIQKLKGQALRLCLLLHSLDAALTGTDGLSPIPENTMRRALLLADWVKAHQAQVWKHFAGDGKTVRAASPIQRAIMEAIVEEAEQIEAEGGKIGNARLVELVNARLPYEVSSDQVGRAAASLGLPLVWLNRGRGRLVRPNKLNSFKASVVSVVSVVKPCAATVSSCNTSKNIVLQVLSDAQADASDDNGNNTSNTNNTKCCTPKSLGHQGQTTLTTLATLSLESNANSGGGSGC